MLHEIQEKKDMADEAGSIKAKAHERTPSPIKQRTGVHEVSMGSLAKNLVALKKHKGKEKVLEPIVESNEQVNFHFFESNGDVNFMTAPLDGPRKEKGGKQSLKCPIVDKSFEK